MATVAIVLNTTKKLTNEQYSIALRVTHKREKKYFAINSLTLKGEIAHMNSLSNDFYRGYKVQTTLVEGYHMPYYIEFTEPEQSSIWLRPLKEAE